MIIIIIITKEGERRRISTCSGYSTGPGWKENIIMVIIIMMMVMVILMMIEILMMMIRKKTDKNEKSKKPRWFPTRLQLATENQWSEFCKWLLQR